MLRILLAVNLLAFGAALARNAELARCRASWSSWPRWSSRR
jgi:hypothetical protein